MKNLIFLILISSLTFVLLLSVIKGSPRLSGSLRYQVEKDTQVGGPFESSNSTSRFALVEAIVENNTFFLSDNLARFASPDLSRIGDKYISIFTPGVSFIAIPFYYLGKFLGAPQLGAYTSTLVLALVNAFLVSILSRRLGATLVSSLVAGFLFLFGTNALPYALTLTQHHASMSVLLLAAINVLSRRTLLNNLILGALYGIGILMDIPNGLMLLPIVVYAISQHFECGNFGDTARLRIKLSIVGLILGLLPMLGVLGWYNIQTTGSYTSMGQTNLGRYDYVSDSGNDQEKISRTEDPKERPLIPYATRNLWSGFYTLLISDERGWVYYSPIVLFGLLGYAYIYKNNKNRGFVATIAASVGVTLLSYSMFGDPWGGWSFGPRYLLPATALVCVGMAVAIDRYRNQIVFGIIFVASAIYSIAVNVLGALTTSAIPPKVEAINLLDPIPYTYTYNLDLLLNKDVSSSLVYNLWFSSQLPAFQYYLIITGITCFVFMALYIASVVILKKKQ